MFTVLLVQLLRSSDACTNNNLIITNTHAQTTEAVAVAAEAAVAAEQYQWQQDQ